MSSRSRPTWLPEALVLAIHDAQIAEHGGAPGVRDAGLLSSALARPQHAAAYAPASIPELGALYALAIIKNHPFVDGNKRIGAVLLETFLELNGYTLAADDDEVLAMILGAASGDLSDERFIRWVDSKSATST